jgi:hypothetical protein
MKTLIALAALNALAFSIAATASPLASGETNNNPTKVTLDQFVDAAVKNPTVLVGADNIKTAKDPVTFTLNLGKTSIETDAAPAAVFGAIRARVPAKTIAGENGISFVQEYGRLTMKGGDAQAPAIYDVEKDITDYMLDAGDDTGSVASYVDNSYKPQSIVGGIVSYYYTSDTYGAGAAHPNYADGLAAVDTTKLEKNGDSYSFAQANLGDLVDEASLVNALKADKWINKILKQDDRKKLAAARNLQELGDVLQEGFMNSESCYSTPIYDGKLQSFAIYDYSAPKNLVAVRVTVGYSSHACAGAAPTVQLGLIVKPRIDLEYSLKEQAKNKTGLLMKNAK